MKERRIVMNGVTRVAKEMAAKFAGHCEFCEGPIHVGTKILYFPKLGVVRHVNGASCAAEIDRRQASKEADSRFTTPISQLEREEDE
jgi:hypothetical protein